MASIERSILIHASVTKIFEYLLDPHNQLDIWPSLVEIRDVSILPEGTGSRYHWVSKVAGIRFEGVTEVVEIEKERRIVLKDGGGFTGVRTVTFEPGKDGVRVVFESEYSLNVPMLGKLIESFVIKESEKEAEVVLANLKARME